MSEQWLVTQQKSWLMEEETGLFVDGVLAASYYQSKSGPYVVNVHEGGNARVSRQILTADRMTARRICRQYAGLPTTETPLPTWAADAFKEASGE